MNNSSITLKIWGDYALFSRPEMKVERVSYDVITPSAARGILEAIYWKPQFRWIIDEIIVLNPIRFTNIRRNEIGKKASPPNSKEMSGETKKKPIYIEDERQQRASLLLKDVAYIIKARIHLFDTILEKGGLTQPTNVVAGKHLAIFQRKAERGQYFHHPCLGTREFPANFELIKSESEMPKPSDELATEKDLGFMLHDLEFDQDFKTKKVKSTTPHFFRAQMKNGVINVPELPFKLAKSSDLKS